MSIASSASRSARSRESAGNITEIATWLNVGTTFATMYAIVYSPSAWAPRAYPMMR